MDVVDAIKAVETGSIGSYRDVPLKPVVIKAVRRLNIRADSTPYGSYDLGW
jgi:hypothetical protein